MIPALGLFGRASRIQKKINNKIKCRGVSEQVSKSHHNHSTWGGSYPQSPPMFQDFILRALPVPEDFLEIAYRSPLLGLRTQLNTGALPRADASLSPACES